MNKTQLRKQYSARIKAWKELNPNIRRGVRSSSDTKAEAVRIAAIGKLLNINQPSTCKKLGITHGTLWNWSNQGKKHPAATVVAIPVPVQPTAKGNITITLSGLTAAQAGSLLKALA